MTNTEKEILLTIGESTVNYLELAKKFSIDDISQLAAEGILECVDSRQGYQISLSELGKSLLAKA
jgi:hypothetical protein